MPMPTFDQTQLPTFIIGGALKAGTTSLNFALKQHPDVFMCPIKEPRYFAYDESNPEHVANTSFFRIRTLPEYEALFTEVTGQKAIGEVSPHYLISELAPVRIRQTIPDVKLVFSLRDPVKRAHSAYWHEVRLGQESRPPEEALVEGEYYLSFGRYHELLQRWYDQFDASQICIILFDDLKRDTAAVVRNLCGFLGVSPDYEFETEVRNPGGAMRNVTLGRFLEKVKTHPLRRRLNHLAPGVLRSRMADVRAQNFAATPPLADDVVLRLNDYYADDILKLEQLINRDLSAWKPNTAAVDAVSPSTQTARN